MSYLYETHYHTPQTSNCCKAPPAQSFSFYSEAGYRGIVITDHYYKEWFDGFHDLTWRHKIEKWLEGYHNAKVTALAYGFEIILGMELRFIESGNDYLVYGIDEALLIQYPELYNMTPAAFREFAGKHGLFFAQAHPFRNMGGPIDASLLHGAEVYNGNPRHNNRNELAMEYAESNGLIKLSGSDFHEMDDLCKGGIYLDELIHNSREFATALFNKKIVGYRG